MLMVTSLLVMVTEDAVAVVVSEETEVETEEEREVETEVLTETEVSVLGRGMVREMAVLLESCALAPSRRRGKRRGSDSACITIVV